MLATTLFAGLLSTYQSGALDFLKDIGMDTVKDVAKETLKSLGEKVIGYFKGKKEGDTVSALKLSVLEKDTENFKAKSTTVLELLKNAVETDADFRKEVESVLNGLDKTKQNELVNAAEKMVSNVANITGDNNINIQGNSNFTIHIGDNVSRDKISKQVNKYTNSKDDDEKR